MKIVFFGTSNFALPILETLHNHHDISLVVTTLDAHVGRKQELTESPVSALAKDMEILTLKPESLKNNAELVEQLKKVDADLFVVASYGKIIPEEILNIPKYKTINTHPSLLPKYRGPTPIQTALASGEVKTGTSIMLLDKEVDHGPILAQEEVLVDSDENYITLSDKLARASAKLLLSTIPDYASGKLVPKDQDHAAATFTKIITKQDGKVDWNKTSAEIYNQFRAFYPWPGIWTTWNGKIVKLTDVIYTEVYDSRATESYEAGVVLDGGIVACGEKTFLQIRSLQLEGKIEMGTDAFLNGSPQFVGSKLD